MRIPIKKVEESAIIPAYQTSGSAGFDLHASEDFVVLPGQTATVSTGLSFEIPEGFELQVRPRSGLAARLGIQVANSPGTIDSDYRGTVKVILYNSGVKNFPVSIGDRIAQGVIAPYIRADFEPVESLSSTERGANGFGSTGTK